MTQSADFRDALHGACQGNADAIRRIATEVLELDRLGKLDHTAVLGLAYSLREVAMWVEIMPARFEVVKPGAVKA